MPALAHDDLSRFRKLENTRVLLSIFIMNSGYESHVQHIYIQVRLISNRLLFISFFNLFINL
jgi:hypothetical protein